MGIQQVGSSTGTLVVTKGGDEAAGFEPSQLPDSILVSDE
jgi:hypothetical protein